MHTNGKPFQFLCIAPTYCSDGADYEIDIIISLAIHHIMMRCDVVVAMISRYYHD